ncbi:MAG TPA: DUF3179 domain-containing protein [Trueperaceae bacterium]|nr:DUF3179 domain-containing protein [Trueperaceae bacterium]
MLVSLLSLASAQPERIMRELGLDLEIATIPFEEILSGGPPPQGIPALGFGGLSGVVGSTPAPEFIAQEEAASWLRPNEPIIVVSLGGETKAYPLQILTWHEIANDVVGGVPVAVTFCPLCNSALAFDRRLPIEAEAGEPGRSESVTVTFGVSGLLYLSNLLMFDDSTHTLWSQLIGEGVVGALAGHELTRYPAQILSFEEFRAAYPDALVMSRETGFNRSYGRNPYAGYDDADSPPFLFQGTVDGRLAPKARVVTIDAEDPVAYPFDQLETERVVHDEIDGSEIVVFWTPGTASALGASQIAASNDVGAVGVFERTVNGQKLTFEWDGEAFVDRETGTRWNILGQGLDGSLAGEQLEPVIHNNTLWFAWAAFRPETRIYQ